jgi:hypothetical protein
MPKLRLPGQLAAGHSCWVYPYWDQPPSQRTMNNVKPGDWCFTPVARLASFVLPDSVAENIMRVAAITYRNPGADLDVFDMETGRPVAEALAETWASFRDLEAIRP